jgi:hypothetical protein
MNNETTPRNSRELRNQIQEAVEAVRSWVDAADIKDAYHRAGLQANVEWLESLLEMAHIELKS